jgi:AcrR family transcriptional regulator
VPPRASDASSLPDGEPGSVTRRAPFSDNPRVGARGQRSQQRILDAALEVFGDVGYHECGVIRITEVAGCSRAAFYQYFSSKEDVFRHLAGQVARQLTASAEALDPIVAGEDGWRSLRAWVERYGDIYLRYEPVFRAFQAAAESDEAVAAGAPRIADRSVTLIRSKLEQPVLAGRLLDAVIGFLLECLSRTNHLGGLLQLALPPSAYPRARLDDALADVVHRTLLGLDPAVNVRPPARRRTPRVTPGPVVVDGLAPQASGLSPTGARTLEALLDAGHQVLITRGYHGTRVDDIASAAGVSHGAFYRYFENKDHLIELLAIRAMRKVASALDDIPDVAGTPGPAGSTALRQWLRRYNTTYASETAMIRVWVDATVDDPRLRLESAASVDWGRRRMARFLAPRDFGDVETDAVVMVSLLDAFGARRRTPLTVDAAAQVIERGMLGRT